MKKFKSMDEDTVAEVQSALLKLINSKSKVGSEGEGIKDDQPVSILALFSFSSIFDRLLIFIGVLASLGVGLIIPVTLIFFSTAIGSMISYSTTADLADTNESDHKVILVTNENLFRAEIFNNTLALFTSGILNMFLCYLSIITLNMAAQRQTHRIQLKFYESILRQDVSWFDKQGSKDFASSVTSDLQKIENGIGEKMGFMIASISTSIFAVIISICLGWKLSLVVLAIFPLVVISKSYVTAIQTRLTINESKAYGKAGSIAEEVLRAIQTVYAFGGESKDVERFANSLQNVKISGIRRSCCDGLSNGVSWSFLCFTYGLSAWFGSKLILQGEYTFDQVLAISNLLLICSYRFGYASPFIEAFATAKGAATGLFNTIKLNPTMVSSATVGKRPEKFLGKIKFESVYFNYPTRPDIPILQGLNLSIESGQTVAVVGASGCGKSTILQLIQRLYDPLSGKIYLDGVDIRDLNVGWLRDQIGTVGQEPVLFAMSIKENIRLGKLGATDEEIILAAKAANAHQFISTLPLGYNTVLGEKGAQISGGQKQRIAIARALIKKPKILLLDEATSALDLESEAIVQEALEKASIGRTTLIVAHRLSTIQNADKIIVVDKGVVQETGCHKELVDKKGLYYRLISKEPPPGRRESKISFKGSGLESEDIQPEIALTSKMDNSLKESRKTQEKTCGQSKNEMSLVKMVFEYKISLLLGLLAAALNGLTLPAYAIAYGDMLGLWSNAEQIKQESDYYGILFLIIGIVAGLVNIFQSYMFGIIGHNIVQNFRRSLFEAYLRQELSWFDKPSNGVGALCTRLSADASAVQNASGTPISVLTQAFSMVIGTFVISFYYNWKLAIVACSMLPICLAIGIAKAKIVGSSVGTKTESTETSTKLAVEVISNIRTVISLRLENHFYGLYKEALGSSYNKVSHFDHLRAVMLGFSQAFSTFIYAMVFFYGGHLVMNHEIDYTVVIKLYQAVFFGASQLGLALAFASDFQKGKIAQRNILEVINRKPKIDKEFGKQLKNIRGDIHFDSVFFSYPERPNVSVLHSLNMVLEAGKTTAIVGASGCGKTTCIQLILRFYDVDSGQLLINDHSIQDLNVSWLRSRIGLVQQEPTLFNYSIQDNIAYGDNRRQVTFDEIVIAAQKANIHKFIESLPEGYLTNVGDCGSQLSGGQKQRIAIARAFIRKPEILLLDEATSALDTESEKIVQETLNEAMKGRTCVVIAHRLSTIQNVDKIIVIDNGFVVEQGTHNQLIELKGTYFKLINRQNATGI